MSLFRKKDIFERADRDIMGMSRKEARARRKERDRELDTMADEFMQDLAQPRESRDDWSRRRVEEEFTKSFPTTVQDDSAAAMVLAIDYLEALLREDYERCITLMDQGHGGTLIAGLLNCAAVVVPQLVEASDLPYTVGLLDALAETAANKPRDIGRRRRLGIQLASDYAELPYENRWVSDAEKVIDLPDAEEVATQIAIVVRTVVEQTADQMGNSDEHALADFIHVVRTRM